jgi:nucleoside 2-deoxyribosyltransferase
MNSNSNSTAKRYVVFLAAPYSNRFDPATDRKDTDLKITLENILNILKSNGYEIRSAHIREDWGNKLMKPADFVPVDYKWIKESDLVIAYVDGTSSGLYIELGWASVLGKNIIILHKEGTHFSPMLSGLNTITNVEIVPFNNNKVLADRLEYVLKNILK